MSATIPSTSPSVVRVERIFRNSARVCRDHAGPSSAVSSRKTSSSEELSATSSCTDDPRRLRSRRPARSSLRERTAHRRRSRSPRSPRLRAPPELRPPAASALGPTPPTRAVSCVERRLDDEPAAVDDQHLVDGLRDLGQHVARDEHRAAPGREGAQEVAQPADAFGIEAVRRLVEDEQLRLAEQRGGEPEPLPHAERVALHAPAGGRLELDQAQHLVDARVAGSRRRARACADGRGRTGPDGSPSPRAPRRPAARRASRCGSTACRRPARARSSARRGRAASAASWSCQRRLGRGSR